MSDFYVNKRTYDATVDVPVHKIDTSKTPLKKWEPPKFSFHDNEFESIRSELSSYSNEKDLYDKLLILKGLLKEGQERSDELRQDMIGHTRRELDENLMPSPDRLMTKLFNPMQDSREPHGKVVDQVRQLQSLYDNYMNHLAPMKKDERDAIFEEIKSKPLDEVLAKYGQDVFKDVLSGYTHEQVEERNQQILARIDQSDVIDSDRLAQPNIERNFKSYDPSKFEHITEPMAAQFMMNLRQNPKWQQANYKGKEAIAIGEINKWSPFYLNIPARLQDPKNMSRNDPAVLNVVNAAQKVIDRTLKGSDDKENIENLTKNAREELLQYFLVHNYYLQDKETGIWSPTVAGAKKYADDMEVVLNDYLAQINAVHAADVKKHDNFQARHGMYGMAVQTYNISTDSDARKMNSALLKETESINHALKSIGQIRKMPESKGETNFWKQLGYTPLFDLLTLGFSEAAESLDMATASAKINRGETLTFGEEQMLTMASALGHAESQDTLERMSRVGRYITPMLPYISTFQMTSPVYRLTHTATKKALGTTSKKWLTKPVFKYTSMRTGVAIQKSMNLWQAATVNLGRMSGALAQTLVAPQYIINNTAMRMQNNMTWYFDPETDELVSAIDKNSADSFGSALYKGFAEAYAEMFTERAGEVLVNFIPGFLKARGFIHKGVTEGLKDLGFDKIAKKRILSTYLKQKGFRDTKQMIDHVAKQQFGWHGVIEEYLEEFVNSWVGFVTGDMTLKDLITKEYWDEQLDTFLTVASFAGLAGAVRTGAEMSVGNNIYVPISQFKADKKGIRVESKKVSFPKWMWIELAENFTEHGVDQDGLSSFIERNAEHLDNDQKVAIMYISQDHQTKAMAREIAEFEDKRQTKIGTEEEGMTSEGIEEVDHPLTIPKATSYDPQITFKEAEKKKEIEKLKDEQALMSLELKRLTDKKEKTQEDKDKVKSLRNRIRAKEGQITKTRNKYDKELGTLNNLAEKERVEILENERKRDEMTQNADLKLQEDIKSVEEKTREIEQKLSDENISEAERTRLNRQRAGLKGQVTKAYSQHRATVNLAYGLPENATQSELERAKRENWLTPEEREEVQKKNKEIEEKFPDLAGYGLLEQDPLTGQYEDPTPQYILEKYKKVRELIALIEESPENFVMYDEMGNRINMSSQMSELLDAQTILEKHLHILGEYSEFQWSELFPSEKWAQLSLELAMNPSMSAEIEYISPGAFRVILPGGREIRGYYSPLDRTNPKQKAQREKIYNAVRDPATKVYFQQQKKADWNPKDEFRDSEGVPYGDRILVRMSDGTTIGSIEINDAYAKKAALERGKAVQTAAMEVVSSLSDYIADLFKVREGVTPLPSRREHHQAIRKALFDLINEVIELLNVSVSEFLKYLRYEIAKADLSPEYKRYMREMVDKNEQAIIDHVIKRRIEMQQKLKSEASKFKAEDLAVPSMESPHWSAEQKIQAHLRGYAKIWSEIAEETGISRERLESEFIRFVHEFGWQSVTNEAEAKTFLLSQKSGNDIRNSIIDKLQALTLPQLISIFDFYENVRVMKHYALRVDNDGFELRDLSAGISYEDFVQQTMSTLSRYQYEEAGKKYQQGFPSVQARIQKHTRDAKKRQDMLDVSIKRDGDAGIENRRAIKLKQHEEDLKLLEDITGIPAETWNEYFVPQTKETEAHISADQKSSDKKSRFSSYQQMLMEDTWNIVYDQNVPGKKRVYPKLQSSLMFNLGLTAKKTDAESEITKFFTQGSEELNTFSNLYKLSTSLRAPSEYALSGVNVSGDRFTMLSQYNMTLKLAEEILNDPRSNRIIDFYKRLGIPMEVILLNGMFGNKKVQGLTSESMTLNDVMLSSIALFSQAEEGSYLGNLGQFGDKGTLYYTQMPKAEMPSARELRDIKKLFPDFDLAVKWMYEEIMLPNSGKLSQIAREYEGSDHNQRMQNLSLHFTYNYAINNEAVLEFLNGDMQQYGGSLVKMVKRAGSSNSPGYRPNTNVEGGVGKSYSGIVLNDAFIYEDGVEVDIADGVVFMSGEMAAKLAVSMGSIYNKLDLFNGTLDSAKILSSFIDKESNSRGLLKGNWLNIDLLAEAMPKSVYAELARMMRENNLDTVSFNSSNKLREPGVNVLDVLNLDGRIKKDFRLNTNDIFQRSTEDLFIQQDLRHPSNPVVTKQASQFLANVLVLPNASKIVNAIAEMRKRQVIEFINKFDVSNLDERAKLISDVKRKWLMDSLDETTDRELIELLKNGGTINEPGVQNYIRARIASAATKEALDLNVMRTATQEIPDIDGQLEGFRLSSDGQHYLLPEAAVGDPTARVHDYTFENNPQGAINFVNENKDQYADLFMPDGTLMEWEIRDRNGVIPGELQMLTRTPADHPHSHTLARIKFRLPGNFTMLDESSRLRSGSDFDGDARYNTSFYKNKKEGIILDNSPRGIANSVLYNLMLDYIDPANQEYITSSINTAAYDNIANKYLGLRPVNPLDIRSFYYSRNDNMVGAKLKGIFTDINSVFSILSYINAGFKADHAYQFGKGDVPLPKDWYSLRKFITDKFGAMKIHIVNLQNMAFDNASDPKLEAMGINEHTVVMFMTLLMTNKSLDSSRYKTFQDHYDAIYNTIEDLARVFNSDTFLRFTELRREASSQSSARKHSEVFTQLEKERGKDKTKTIRSLFSLASSINEMAVFLKLTREVPSDISSFLTAVEIYKSFHRNDSLSDKNKFDKRSFFDKNGRLKALFSSAEKIIELGQEVIYSDSVDLSQTGIQIISRIWSELSKVNKNNKRFREDEIRSISRSLNNIVAIMAMEPDMPFMKLQQHIVTRITDLRNEFPENEFLNNIQRIVKKATGITEVQISFDLRKAKLSDTKLKKIRDDFDLLPETDKKNFYVYAIQKFGSSTSTMHGSYFNHIGLKYRADASKTITRKIQELNDLTNVSSVDKAFITQWMLRSSAFSQLRTLAVNHKDYRELPDIATIPYLKSPWMMSELQEIVNLKSINDLQAIFARKNVGKIEKGKITFNKTVYNSIAEFQDYISSTIDRIRERAELTYPSTDMLNDRDVRSMMSNDSLQEPFAIEDEVLQDFIISSLQKSYPGVQIFTDKAKFFEFVRKNNGRLFNVDTNAIGHAFKNAVFIDPQKAVQSTVLHEYSHIYWDTLPDNHPVKERLREFYRKNNPARDFETKDELDERIIIDIGKIGTDRASIRMRGSLYQRFLNLVKLFWAEVKNLLGIAGQQDLLAIIANNIWNNHADIKTENVQGNALIRNMIMSNEKVSKRSHEHVYLIDSVPVANVTGVVRKTGQEFDAEIQANKKAQREATKISAILASIERRGVVMENMEEDFRVEFQAEFESAAERGSSIHAIAEHVFMGADIKEQSLESFADYNPNSPYKTSLSVNLLKKNMKDLKEKILQAFPDAVFYSEKIIGSSEFGVAGTVDLIVDIGNDKLFIIDFKSTTSDYLDNKGDPTIDYTRKYGLRSDIAQTVPLSHEGDHGLQLHLYRELLESQKSDTGGKNQIMGMFIIPVKVDMNQKNKIIAARIPVVRNRAIPGNMLEEALHEKRKTDPDITDTVGWIYFDPRDPIYRKVSKSLLAQHRKISQDSKIAMTQMKRNLQVMGFTDYAIDQMMKAHSYLSFMMGDLKEVTHNDVASLRNTAVAQFRRNLFMLGYTKENILSMNSERLFYASLYNIKPEDIDSHFVDFAVRSKYTRERVLGAVPKWYSINIKEGRESKEGEKFTVRDAGTKDLKEGDEVIRYYSVSRDMKMENLFFRYKVIEVNKTLGKLTLENEEGNRTEMRGIEAESGVLLIHRGAVPKGIEVEQKFSPMYVHHAEDIVENHFAGTTKDVIYKNQDEFENAGMRERDWNHYKSSMFKVWDFFNTYDNYEKLYNLMFARDTMQEIYEQLRGSHESVAKDLRDFLGESLVNHYLAEALTSENAQGPVNFMPMTLQFYYLVTLNENVLFRDFDVGIVGQGLKYFMFPDFISGEYIPLAFSYSAIAKAIRETVKNKYDVDAFLKKHKDFIERNINDLTVEIKDHLYWIHPKDALLMPGQAKEFIEGLYKFHNIYDKDYIARSKVSPMARVEVINSRMTKSEAKTLAGKHAKEFLELVRPQPWDNVDVTLKERSELGPHWKNFIDPETGNPVKVKFREIREEYAKKVLDRESVFKYFGNRFQRYLARNPLFTNNFANVGSLYHKYKIDAKKAYYNEMSKRTGRVVNLPSLRPVSKKYASKHIAVGHFNSLESVIYNHHMKDILSPYDWVKQQYSMQERPGNKNHILDYIRDQIDTSVFKYTDNYEQTEMYKALGNFMIRWASLVYMAYQPTTQVFNAAIGHLQDMVYEPKAYFTGWKRILRGTNEQDRFHLVRMYLNYKKAFKILKKFGLANMVEETQFQELDRFFTEIPGLEGREHTVFEKGYDWAKKNINVENFINKGYWLLEQAEKSIQIPIFVGMMTETEWNSYDLNANIINKDGQLSEARADELTRRVGYIHGFYSKAQASPFAQTPAGAGIFQFRKFLPPLYHKLFGTYRYDRSFQLRSGMAQSIAVVMQIAKFAGLTGKEKKMERIQLALQSKEQRDLEDLPFHVSGMSQYFDDLIIKLGSDAKLIEALKKLPANEKRNLMSAGIQAAVIIALYASAQHLFPGPDDDFADSAMKKYIRLTLQRIAGDILYFFEMENVLMLYESPAAGLGVFLQAFKTLGMLNAWLFNELQGKKTQFTHYQQDGLYYERGQPKIFYHIGNIIPVGSAYRLIYRNAYRKWLDSQLQTITDPETAEPALDREGNIQFIFNPATNKPMTKWDVRKESLRWQKMISAIEDALIYGQLLEKDYDPAHIFYIEEYMRRSNVLLRNIGYAASMAEYQNLLDTGDPETLKIKDYLTKYHEDNQELREQIKMMSDLELIRQIKRSEILNK